MRPIPPSTLRKAIVIPLVLGILASVVIRVSNLDPNYSGRFYDPESGQWFGKTSDLCQLIYDYGTMPAVFLGVGGLIWAAYGLIQKPRRPDRRALYLGLCLIVGPGLAVNAAFKDNFGRPRPRDTVLFGGEHQFHPVGTPGSNRGLKSFPSGHASMGFLLGIPALLVISRRRWRFWFWMTLGISAGAFIGWVRIAQGGHWFSDVLWSGLFVYFIAVGVGLATGVLRSGREPYRPFHSRHYTRLPSAARAIR